MTFSANFSNGRLRPIVVSEPENLALVYLRRIDEKIDRMDGRLSELGLRVNEVHASVIAACRDRARGDG